MTFIALLALAASASPTVAQVEAGHLRAADRSYSAALAKRDLNAAAGAFAADGRFFAPNFPAATTRAAIRKQLGGMFAVPGMNINCVAGLIQVAKSGDVGFTSGRYTTSWTSEAGKPAIEHGNYVTVWKREPGGTWKVVLDTFASDDP